MNTLNLEIVKQLSEKFASGDCRISIQCDDNILESWFAIIVKADVDMNTVYDSLLESFKDSPIEFRNNIFAMMYMHHEITINNVKYVYFPGSEVK